MLSLDFLAAVSVFLAAVLVFATPGPRAQGPRAQGPRERHREAQGGPREGPGRPREAQGGKKGGEGPERAREGGEGPGPKGPNVTSVCLIIAAVIGTWDLGPATWDLGPGTWDLRPRTRDDPGPMT